jgi:hypothetical protein
MGFFDKLFGLGKNKEEEAKAEAERLKKEAQEKF